MAKKATTTKTATKTATKKSTAKKGTKTKKTPKKSTGKASYLQKGLSSKEFHAQMAKKPIAWSENRMNIVKALRKKGATSATKAISAEDIVAVCKVDLKKVKIHCDAYRGTELVAKGFVSTIKLEGSRSLSYYLTSKGAKSKFE